MLRLFVLMIACCLLLVPVASAEGSDAPAEPSGGESQPTSDGEPEGHAHGHDKDKDKDKDKESGEDDQNSNGDGDDGVPEPTCELYHFSGNSSPYISVNPVLGLVWLTPMDCVEEFISV